MKEINYKNENLKQQAKNSQSDNSILLNDSTKKLLQVDTESINKKFFMNSFQDLTIGDQQKMFTQFYDILKLVDNFKKENAEIVIGSISTTTTNNNGIGR